jgi:GT2 family glycosyltransferase
VEISTADDRAAEPRRAVPSLEPGLVTVVVITRNRRDSLFRTLRHLLDLPEQPPVIVVDNGSDDGSAAAVEAAFPSVVVIPMRRNIGASARNVGARRATTPYVAFADDDSWWRPGALGLAARHLDAHPRLGVLAARTVVGPTCRPDPMNAALAGSPLGVPSGAPGPAVLGFLAFAAVMRRQCFLQAGGFSDLLFFLGEESLLAWDAAAAGWLLAYCPDVVAVHHPSPPEPASAAARRTLQQRNALLTTWLRRPAPIVARDTLRLAVAGVRDPTARQALAAAALRAPQARRHRRLLPAQIERDIRRIETAGRPGAEGSWLAAVGRRSSSIMRSVPAGGRRVRGGAVGR